MLRRLLFLAGALIFHCPQNPLRRMGLAFGSFWYRRIRPVFRRARHLEIHGDPTSELPEIVFWLLGGLYSVTWKDLVHHYRLLWSD
jgi:hypothetical protein